MISLTGDYCSVHLHPFEAARLKAKPFRHLQTLPCGKQAGRLVQRSFSTPSPYCLSLNLLVVLAPHACGPGTTGLYRRRQYPPNSIYARPGDFSLLTTTPRLRLVYQLPLILACKSLCGCFVTPHAQIVDVASMSPGHDTAPGHQN